MSINPRLDLKIKLPSSSIELKSSLKKEESSFNEIKSLNEKVNFLFNVIQKQQKEIQSQKKEIQKQKHINRKQQEINIQQQTKIEELSEKVNKIENKTAEIERMVGFFLCGSGFLLPFSTKILRKSLDNYKLVKKIDYQKCAFFMQGIGISLMTDSYTFKIIPKTTAYVFKNSYSFADLVEGEGKSFIPSFFRFKNI
jgi:hypothetical protein